LSIAAISSDSVSQNAALADKLILSFPVLSDPDCQVIRQWGVHVDATSPTVLGAKPEPDIAKPAVFVVRTDWTIAFRYVGRDQIIWIDRPTDEEIFAAVEGGEHGTG
jgi:peroxiredoxin